jgi:hypothetical protein
MTLYQPQRLHSIEQKYGNDSRNGYNEEESIFLVAVTSRSPFERKIRALACTPNKKQGCKPFKHEGHLSCIIADN